MAILPISHVAISCKDPIEIEKFYTKYFGFKRARVYSPGPEQVVMIKSGSTYLELFKSSIEAPIAKPEGAGQDYPGWRHICFLVEDIEAKLSEIGKDTKLSLGPVNMSMFIPNMKVCWIKDPEGNIVELNQGYIDEDDPPKLV